MRSKNGFTLIELLITITIMAILLTLTVVSLRSSQAVARDEERKTDVAAIALALENYFDGDFGDNPSFESSGKGTFPKYQEGYYPPTAYVANEAAISESLHKLDLAAIRAPGVANTQSPSLVGATSIGAQTPNVNTYIYKPLKADGGLCSVGAANGQYFDQCTDFVLYYQLETVSGVQTITSKRR
jgi:prepilin-type N-terminal cleavage/methylation domain-containing protein